MRRTAPVLPAPLTAPEPTVVLLPVRNEERNLSSCLETLKALRGVAEIRVVDDHSSDDTAAIARRFGAEDARIRVLVARELPPGWGGKLNALATGLEAPPTIRTPWLLFTDADTRHAPEVLAKAQAAACQHRLAAVSLAGFQRTLTLGEKLFVPLVFALLDGLLGSWKKQARGEAKRSVANGQFFLVRQESLAAIGGLGPIAGDLLDDVALAEALRGRGYRVGFWRAGRGLEVQMYAGLKEAFLGWRRNLALYLGRVRGRFRRVLTALSFPLLLFGGSLLGEPSSAWLWGYGLGVLGSLLLRSGEGWGWSILWPLELALLLSAVGFAAYDRKRGWTVWRGRSIPLQRP
jgi:glycosyltransferase involved in cell wall biosynthesis